MKKFFIVLFILIILGGVVFFFGWAQLSVPPGAYGVLSSKTHGVDPRPIQSGEFRWLWYKLIPTNVSISVFHIEPVERAINSRGQLPSGDVYAAFLGRHVDFSWEFDAVFSFSISPEELTSLAQENSIVTQDDLTRYQSSLADNIESLILLTFGSQENTAELEAFLTGFSEELEKTVREKFPLIGSFSCFVRNVRFPDFILYRQARGLYEDFIAMQRDYTAASMTQMAESRIEMQMRLEELERYGELITRYPLLLHYLALPEAEGAQ